MAKLGDVCEINPKAGVISDDTEVSFVPMQNVTNDGRIDPSGIKKYCDVKKGFTNFRACLKIGDVSSSEGFWASGKQFFRRNPGGFQGKIAPSREQKPRWLGMLTFFKQALGLV